MTSTINSWIILQNMVVKTHKDWYDSECWKLGEGSRKEGMFTGENGEEMVFK